MIFHRRYCSENGTAWKGTWVLDARFVSFIFFNCFSLVIILRNVYVIMSTFLEVCVNFMNVYSTCQEVSCYFRLQILLDLILTGVLLARQVCEKHNCGVQHPKVSKSFNTANGNFWIRRTFYDTSNFSCRICISGEVSNCFIHSKERRRKSQFIWISAYFTTSPSWLCWLTADCTHRANLI